MKKICLSISGILSFASFFCFVINEALLQRAFVSQTTYNNNFMIISFYLMIIAINIMIFLEVVTNKRKNNSKNNHLNI